MFGKLQTVVRQPGSYLADAFATTLLDTDCVSVLNDGPLTLPRHYIREASAVWINLTIRKPIFPHVGSSGIEVRVFDSLGCPLRTSVAFESEHPADSGVRLSVRDQPQDWVDSAQGRLVRVEVKLLDTAWIEQRFVRVVVSRRCSQRPLGTFYLFGLEEARLTSYTHARVLRSLQVEHHALWIQSGRLCYRSDQLPVNSDAVVATLTLRSTGFNSRVSNWATTLTLNALFADEREPLCQAPILLSEHASITQILVVPVQGSCLAARPGVRSLSLSVAGHDLLMLPLRVIAADELMRRTRVQFIEVDAITPDSGRARNVRVVRRSRCRSLQASVVMRAPVLAPNTSFSAVVCWSRAGKLLHQSAFNVTLDQHSQRFVLRALELPGATSSDPIHPDELTMTVQVGSEVKKNVQLLIIPDEPLTDSEGQLKSDPEQLLIHQAEYEDILRRLEPGVSSVAASQVDRP